VVRRYGEADAILKALDAGADVILMPVNLARAIDILVSAIESGRVPESRIDASVRRILEAKAAAGLPRGQFVDLDAVDDHVAIRAHLQLAQLIAERSITLPRDNGNLVPLTASVRGVLSISYVGVQDPVAGAAFDNTLRAAGKQVISRRIDRRVSTDEIAALTARADSVDAVVVSTYVSPVEYSGPLETANVFAQFVDQLAVSGKPVVVVAMGSPYVITSFPGVSAYLLAWGGAPVSQIAAARALLGLAPITGKLPVSIPPHFTRGNGLERGRPHP
jgi:beta-N-acetylhexosaminidase